MLNIEDARRALQKVNMRWTPQRQMIVEALIDNRSHPTIEDIYNVVRRRYPALSLATVYQTVALLIKHGLLLELRGSKSGLRCDPDTSPHAHAYCRECGAVYDISLPHVIPIERMAPEGFHAENIEVAVHGHCHRCTSIPTDLTE